MTLYRPFIDDPEHLGLVDGERYVVLRPPPEVRHIYFHLQRAIKQKLSHRHCSFPAEPHVTFAGFAADSGLELVREVVQEWSLHTAPLILRVERIGSFPRPDQIVVIEIRKTPELQDAMVRLRSLAVESNLALLGTIDPGAWVFHMSIAYCSQLGENDWTSLLSSLDMHVTPIEWVANEAEIAAFDSGREHSGGIFTFASRSSTAT